MYRCKSLTLKGSRCTFFIAHGNRSYCTIHSKILNKKPVKKIISRSRKKHKLTKLECKKKLQDKIRVNMRHRDDKGWSQQQAIAISYSQVKKKYPVCRNIL